MGVLEEQARFLTAKYGTAAGPVGMSHAAPPVADAATIMIVLGLLVFLAVLVVLVRDWQTTQSADQAQQLA